MPRLITIQLIHITTVRGDGLADPYRQIDQWFTTDGILVLDRDDYEDKTMATMNLVDHLRKLKPAGEE